MTGARHAHHLITLAFCTQAGGLKRPPDPICWLPAPKMAQGSTLYRLGPCITAHTMAARPRPTDMQGGGTLSGRKGTAGTLHHTHMRPARPKSTGMQGGSTLYRRRRASCAGEGSRRATRRPARARRQSCAPASASSLDPITRASCQHSTSGQARGVRRPVDMVQA